MTAVTKRKRVKKSQGRSAADAEFKAMVSSLRGSMSWLNITVDGYLHEKHTETGAERLKGTVVTSDKRFSDASAFAKIRQIR